MATPWLEQCEDGAWLAPSFVDRHCHPLFAAREAASLDLSKCHSVESILETLRGHLAANPQTKWIDATPFDRSIADEFLSTTLDQVSDLVPITLHSADHHALWVNSPALRIARLLSSDEAADLPSLSGAEIVCDANGRPSGLLLEWGAMKLVLDKQPTPSLEQDLLNLSAAQTRLSAAGVRAVTDAWIDPGMGEVYLEAAARGFLELPTELWVRVAPDEIEQQLGYLESLIAMHEQAGSPANVNIRGIKLFLDGVLSSQTAALFDSYRDGSKGELIWCDDELLRLLDALNEISPSLRPHFHAIGDRAVNQALNIIEAMQLSHGWNDANSAVIAHADLVSVDDAVRCAVLPVELVISPQWLEHDTESAQLVAALPPELLARVGDFTPLVRSGTKVTYGSDWPVSEPNPLIAVAHATNHLIESGYPAEEAVDIAWGIASGRALGHAHATLRIGRDPKDLALADPAQLALIQILH